MHHIAEFATLGADARPCMMAVDTAKAAGLLEVATSGELNFTQKQVLSPRQKSRRLRASRHTHARHHPEDRGCIFSACQFGCFRDSRRCALRTRLGTLNHPTHSRFASRPFGEFSILSLHGIPPALVAAQGTGTALRESFRQVLHSLLKPLGGLVVSELREKLAPGRRA